MTNRDDYWDKILSEIDMDYIPIEYMNTVVVRFHDGKEWEIDLAKPKQSETDVEQILAHTWCLNPPQNQRLNHLQTPLHHHTDEHP